MLLGRWVPTIVATNPNRRARRGASITEPAWTSETVKKSHPRDATVTP